MRSRLLTGLLAAAALASAGCQSLSTPHRAAAFAPDDRLVVLENSQVRLEFDLRSGTYSAYHRADGALAVERAHVVVDGLRSTDPGLTRTWSERAVSDALGEGRAITIESTAPGRPILVFEAALYDDHPFVVLAAGIENTGSQPLRVHEIEPLAGARAFPDAQSKVDLLTLNGTAGATETFVARGGDRMNENNLLATFLDGGQRRSIVWGGLAYHEFAKYAAVGDQEAVDESRLGEIKSLVPDGYNLIGYIRPWTGRWLDVTFRKMIRRASAIPYQFPGAPAVAEPWFATTSLANEYIEIWNQTLDPERQYQVGFTWWDFDGSGRSMELVAESMGQTWTIVPERQLPSYARDGAMPEMGVAQIPPEAYAIGHAVLFFRKTGESRDAVVGEFWIMEAEGGDVLDEPVFQTVPTRRDPRMSDDLADLRMKGSDPQGKRVNPGVRFGLDEKFYIDFATADPFEALEAYGLAIRNLSGIAPNIYDFPTVCAWYASGSYPGCPYVNHTPGMVDEARYAQSTGFTRYSPAAVRVVPDVIGDQSEQGWWNDEMWQRGGHYREPYETSAKFARAVLELGSIPFTYVHACLPNHDFLGKHPQWALGWDSAHPDRYSGRGYDFSHPGFVEHVQGVWRSLRLAGIPGVMFDYPGSAWQSGGFHDDHMTTGGFYRRMFQLAKEGLGPGSFIHERVIGQYGQPQTDVTIGLVDSQRTEWDTHLSTPEMYTKVGLRWYKNRVLYTYDMDAKNFLHVTPYNSDGLNQLLTMSYMVAPRLLLATSFRSMEPHEVHALSRIYPIHDTPKSPRPLDMLSGAPFPRIYSYDIEPGWAQLAFYNHDIHRPAAIRVDISRPAADGGMGLDASRSYHVHDFWNDAYLGVHQGAGAIEQRLRPGEVRMMSVRAVQPNPQYLSTNRHVMQGYVDMERQPAWDAASSALSGSSRVVGGEAYEVVIAGNGREPVRADARGARATIAPRPGHPGIHVLAIESDDTAAIEWTVEFR